MKITNFLSLIRPFAVIGSFLGFCAVVLTFYLAYISIENDNLLRLAIFFVALISVVAFFVIAIFTLFNFYFKESSPSKLALLATADLEKFVPAETVKILRYFLESILPHVFRFRENFRELNGIRIEKFVRKFELSRRDVTVTEQYHWNSKSRRKLERFPIIRFGGNIQTFEDANAKGWEEIDGQTESCGVSVEEIADRVLLINIRLKQISKRNASGIINYSDFSKGAMLPDWDIALIPHPAYFTHRLGSLAFEILSDTPLLETELYALSTYTGERVRVEAKTEVSTEGKRYGATVIKPKRNHIYFVLFKR